MHSYRSLVPAVDNRYVGTSFHVEQGILRDDLPRPDRAVRAISIERGIILYGSLIVAVGI